MVVELDRVGLSSLSSCRCCLHRLRRALLVVAMVARFHQEAVEEVNSSSCCSRRSLHDRFGYCIVVVGIDHSHLRLKKTLFSLCFLGGKKKITLIFSMKIFQKCKTLPEKSIIMISTIYYNIMKLKNLQLCFECKKILMGFQLAWCARNSSKQG